MNIQEHREALAAINAQRDKIVRQLGLPAAPSSPVMTAEGLEGLLAMIRVTPAKRDLYREDEILAEQARIHAKAINDDIRAKQQAKVNAREAAANRKALCGSCFTVHAGECY